MKNNNLWLPVLVGFVLGAVIVSLISGRIYRNRMLTAISGWGKLNVILSQVDKNYVDTVDKAAVTDAALEAALQALDPHSVYMKPEPLKEAEEDLAGGFEGIGIQFNVPNDTAVVLSVIAGGPSEKAGVLPGDRIIMVDDRCIAGNKTPQDTMVHLMKGPKGTKVTVTMERGTETIPFEITRDKIPEHSVDAAFMADDTTGYLRLSKFNRTTYEECLKAIEMLKGRGMTHLVFDLRGNTGGYYDQACNLANLFLPEDALIVYMEGLHRKRQDTRANGRGLYRDLPLSVLIDDGSASAAEIFAGAMQDNDRGTIVGRRSFGKGLVQEPVYLNDGSGIRLTVARFYTPSGRCIQKPYSNEYQYDLYYRYANGELTSADSIKVDSSKVYKTVGGRTVYGGGGIIPDVFVPLDTTKASSFYIACNRKSAIVRFSNRFFDNHRSDLSGIDGFNALSSFLDGCDVEGEFLNFCSSLGIKPASTEEWRESATYMMPQIKGLCGRYSKMGEEAYYRYILPYDDVVNAAIGR